MIFNLSAGGGSTIAYKFQTSQPTGSKNLIWFKTSTQATYVYFTASFPTSPTAGDVYVFENEHSHVTVDIGNGNTVELLYLGEAYQYNGSSWVHIEGYIYQGNTWVQFSGAIVSFIQVTTTDSFTSLTATNGIESHSNYTSLGNNVYEFEVFNTGTWTVTMTDGTKTATSTTVIDGDNQIKQINITYSTIPEFTYIGGTYEIVDDSDTPIVTSQDNWKIRFLTSGTLNFSQLNGASNGIDLFLVGGGGGSGGKSISGGGGGGYTASHGGISVSTGIDYEIVVGDGGVKNATSGTNSAAGGDGGASSAFGESIEGGKGGASYNSDTQSRTVKGGDGGSGGAGSLWNAAYNGGSDGRDGSASSTANKGLGQGTSTREFYELDQDATATLYAGGGGNHANDKWGVGGAGGGGGTGTAGGNGVDNLGGGASGYGYAGGTGIVIIRNARS